MKGKLLTTAILAALLVGSNAMASVARQAVFGTQPVFTSGGAAAIPTNAVNGSLWYDDDYNVFYNPAYINDNKNFVTVDKGAEGGFFKGEFENFAYGVYFNRGQGSANSHGPQAVYGGNNFVSPGVRTNTSLVPGQTALNTQRPLDIFIGGDTGLKWGFHAAWAYNRNQTGATQPDNGDGEVTNRYWHFDLGAEILGFEPFIGATILSKYESTVAGSTAKQDLDEFNVGARYKYEGWTPYVTYKKMRASGLSTQATQAQVRHSIIGGGIGHDTKVADGVHVIKNIGLWYNRANDDTFATEQFRKYSEWVLPVNVALEAEATSWLVLRAGVTFDVINEQKYDRSNAVDANSVADRKQSIAGSTRFRIGSTFKFGKLHLDSAFGNGAAATTSAGLDNESIGFDSQTFGLVSASYHW